MDIMMVAAELAPYARASAAGESIAALSKALRQLGHNVTIALPRYPGFEAGGLLLARRLTPLGLPSGGEITVFDGQLASGVQIALFDAPVLYERPGVYGESGKDYPDNPKRFGLLCQAAAALVRTRTEQGSALDVLHLHDWPAALLPIALSSVPGPELPSLLTIHDVSRQGSFSPKELDALGIPKELNSPDAAKLGSRVNVLKAGIQLADAITTVSPNYAQQIMREETAGPLAAVLESVDRQKPIVGITNGLDYAIYNPAVDSALVSRYDAEDPSNKGRSKTALLRELGLELDAARPLLVAHGEIGAEAGFDLVLAALPAVLKQNLTCIVAGSGNLTLCKKLSAIEERYPDRFRFRDTPDDAFVHRLYGAADMALLAARQEPCGQAQLWAQRYGALPVAFAGGGVLDTVVDTDAQLETGTGFLFDDHTPKGLQAALGRALAAYASPAWPRLVRRVMRLDLGWDRPARRYLQVYRQIISAHG